MVHLQEYYSALSFSKGDDGLGDPGVFVYIIFTKSFYINKKANVK